MFGRLISRFLLALGLVVSSGAALANDDHDHLKGPHGGEVKGFGDKLHIEAVRKGAAVSLFVLDGDGKRDATVAKHGGGSITVLAPGAKQEKVELAAGQDFSKAEAKAPEEGKVTVLVTVKIEGKTVTATFGFE